jgi:hypothetical protein
LTLFVRRSRPALLLAGVVFHIVLYYTMNIVFFQNVVLYAVFVDFGALADRLPRTLRQWARPVTRRRMEV